MRRDLQGWPGGGWRLEQGGFTLRVRLTIDGMVTRLACPAQRLLIRELRSSLPYLGMQLVWFGMDWSVVDCLGQQGRKVVQIASPALIPLMRHG